MDGIFIDVVRGNFHELKKKLENGSNPNEMDFFTGSTAVQYALNNKKYEFAKVLLENGAKLHVNDKVTEKLNFLENDKFKEIAERILKESGIDVIGEYKKNIQKKAAKKAARKAIKEKQKRGLRFQ